MRDRVLLVASNFPPVVGGSAVVYGQLAAMSAGRTTVMAPQVSYHDGLPQIGWREHDRLAGYRVIRPRLLRTVIDRPGETVWQEVRRRCRDLWGRLTLVRHVVWAIVAERIGLVCFGEAVASRWLIRLLRWCVPVKIAVYIHGEELTTDDNYDREHRRASGAMMDADLVFTVSPFTRAVVLEMLGPGAAAKVVLNGNGVDLDRFTPGPRRPDLVARYGLEEGFTFVSVCRLVEKKGIDMALHAFARVSARHPGCRFLVVGDGPEAAGLRDLAGQLRIEERVVFAGAVPDEEIADHYRLGDVFLMPNRTLENGDTEGFGLVFLEANACGLPVIGGEDGGTASAIEDGVSGFRVDARHVGPVAAAMLRMVEDPALRARLREGALALAARSDWRTKVELFHDACTVVMGTRAHR